MRVCEELISKPTHLPINSRHRTVAIRFRTFAFEQEKNFIFQFFQTLDFLLLNISGFKCYVSKCINTIMKLYVKVQ